MEIFVMKIVDSVYNFLSSWPSIDRYTAVSLLTGILSFLLTIVAAFRSKKAAEHKLLLAREELKEKIIFRVNTPDLLKVSSLRSLALGVQMRRKTPAITDPMIAEAIRIAAIELEDRYKTPNVILKRLRALDEPLEVLDNSGSKLASIAARCRVFSYLLSVLGFGVSIFAALVWVAHSANTTIRHALLTLVLLLQLLLLWQAIRALNLWITEDSTTIIMKTMKKLGLADPESKLDLFVYNASTSNHSVHTNWAPLWETVFFQVLPTFILPFLAAWATFHAGLYLEISSEKLRLFIRWIVWCGIGAAFLSNFVFNSWHEYSVFRVQKLRKELNILERDNRLAELGYQQESRERISRTISLLNDLWAISGDNRLRNRKTELHERLKDMEITE